jgi:hypothetical protein
MSIVRAMQLRLSLFVVLAALVAACGGGSSERPPVVIDSPGGDDIDAPDGDNPPAQGLGAVCNEQMPCPASAPICAQLSAGAVNGFCTLVCGQTAAGAMEPPANGNMTCQTATPAPGNGTPACVLTAAPNGNTMDWACGIGCGDLQGTQLGECPGGLTCTDNLCQ